MLDETRAHFLQDVYYISSRSPIILGMLQEEVRTISHILLHIQARKTKYFKDFTEDAWQTSTSFISIYLKNPEFKCNSFRNRIYLEVKYQLYNPKQKREDAVKYVELTQTNEYSILPTDEPEDVRYVLEDIKDSKPENYNVILFDCYKSKSYKSFILKLDSYLPRRWIYDHAVRLKLLYKNTRRVTK